MTENGVTTTTDYTLHGKLITHMTQGSNNLHFYYDGESRPSMVNFNGTMYTYVHNLQGDVVAILDTAGTIMVEYKYDAWGRIIATTGSKSATLGKLNPFRYRGYVYDEETRLYYLRSRYYSPARSRFLNADKYSGSLKSCERHNVYGYCDNAPTIKDDVDGAVASVIPSIASGVVFGKVATNLFESMIIDVIGEDAFVGSSKRKIRAVTGNYIEDDEAKAHNAKVDRLTGCLMDTIGFLQGIALGKNTGKSILGKTISKAIDGFAGSHIISNVWSEVQSYIAEGFHVRASGYDSIYVTYEHEHRDFGVIPCKHYEQYHLKIYKDYIQVYGRTIGCISPISSEILLGETTRKELFGE